MSTIYFVNRDQPAKKFNVGDIVNFNANGQNIKMKVEGYTYTRTCLKGSQIGGVRRGRRLTIGFNECTLA